jgi:hypothetical protein
VPGNLTVGQTPGDQRQDLAFPLGQDVERGGGDRGGAGPAGELGDQPAGHARGEQRVAGGDDPDRGEQFAGGCP